MMFIGQGIYLVLFVLMFNHINSVNSLIRYYSNEDLETRNVIEVYHDETGVSSRQWSVATLGCQFTDDTAQTTDLVCTSPGLHTVTLNYVKGGNQVLTKRINVGRRFYCYQWYIYQPSYNLTSIDNEIPFEMWNTHLHVWIMDPRYASAGELNRSAEFPSGVSALLTNQFRRLGLVPHFDASYRQLYTAPLNHSLIQYMEENSCWLLALNPVAGEELQLKITSQPIPLYSCLVRDTIISLPESSIPNDIEPALNLTETTLIVSMDEKLVRHPCHEHTAVYVAQNDKLFWTTDGFLQTRIPLVSLNQTSVTVTDVALSLHHLILLADGNIYAIDVITFETTVLEEGTSAVSVIARNWCCSKTSGQSYNHMFMSWWEDGLTYNHAQEGSTSILLPSGYSIFKVLHVAFSPSCNYIGVVAKVNDGSTQLKVYLYHLLRDSWIDITTLPYGGDSHPYGIQFVWGASNKMLIWYGSDVHFISHNVKEAATTVQSRSITPHVVQHVTPSYHGYIVITVVTGEVYATNSLWNDLVQLELTVPSQTPMVPLIPWFEQTDLKMLLRDGDLIQLQRYPLYNEIINSHYPDILCPLGRMHTGGITDYQYMDRTGNTSVWASMVYPKEYYSSNSTFLQFNYDGDEDVAKITIDNQVTLAEDRVMENMSVTFENSPEVEYTAWWNKTGEIGYTISPAEVPPICMETSQVTSYVTTGCHPEMYLRLEPSLRFGNTDRKQCNRGKFDDWDFTVNGGPNDGVEHHYPIETIGCPQTHDLWRNYYPNFSLCVDQKCEPLLSNYIVWEDYGAEFDYGLNMIGAGCLRPAQTWSQMLNLAGTTDKSTNVWGSHNYQSCFIKNASMFDDRSMKYEILNKTNGNFLAGFPGRKYTLKIRWDGDYYNIDTMYIMNMRVVDPDLSFCNLELKFGVRVMGVPKRQPPLQPAVVFTFVAFLISLFSWSYCHFRNKHFNVPPEVTDEWLRRRDQILINLGFVLERTEQPVEKSASSVSGAPSLQVEHADGESSDVIT